ncbi:MAG: amidohydrolase family protein [Gammaproteobacteria bacterium]
MNRRSFMLLMGASVLHLTGCRFPLDEGIWNPCLNQPLPQRLLNHGLVQRAWEGIDESKVWDCHAHLIGVGDGGYGIWLNPEMQSLGSPQQFVQLKFYLNAACVEDSENKDRAYVDHILSLMEALKPGVKLMLLAFDYHYDEQGKRIEAQSPFYTPNEYAANLVKAYPDQFEWIASVHPYREDCVDALEWAVKHGARAVKWLPPAMGMNPASPLCDRFYNAMNRLNIPLLTHAGDEHAVKGKDAQALGNPLLLRRALEHGVRVVVAHCASQGSNEDLDKGKGSGELSNFDLFSRMMDEPDHVGLLYGDISAMTQINRAGIALETIIKRKEWHVRLLNGSDYPLPGVMPLFSLIQLQDYGYIREQDAPVLSNIRKYNPLLFDFVLKRHLQVDGQHLSREVFETRRVFSS